MTLKRRHVIVPKRVAISQFLEKACSAIFAGRQFGSKGVLSSVDYLSDEPTHLVASSILQALAEGSLKASVKINLANPPTFRDVDSLAIDLLDEDTVVTWNSHYLVSTEFWARYKDERLTWNSSEARIPIRYLFTSNNESLSVVRIDLPSSAEYTAIIEVENADVSFGQLFGPKEVMDEEKFKRHLSQKSRLNDALVMLAWRYLAIERPGFDESPNALIVAHMRDYLGRRGFHEDLTEGMSKASLTQLTTAVLKQWKNKAFSERVWLNSAGDPPFRPKKANPRRPAHSRAPSSQKKLPS